MFFPIFYFLSHLTVSPEPFGYTINYVLLWFKWSHSLSNIHWHFFFLQSIILIWQTRSVLLVFWKAKWSKIWYRYNDLVSTSSITLWPILDLGFLEHTHLWILSQLHIYAIKIPPKVFLVQKRKKKHSKSTHFIQITRNNIF